MRVNASAILTEDYLKSCENIKTYKDVMNETGCSKSAVYNYAKKFGVKLKANYVSGDKHYKWQGGKYEKKGRGYMVKVDDPNYKYGYRPEHCVLMEGHIGRKMKESEVVHHVDGNPYNNNLSNLLLLDKNVHDRFHLLLGALQYDHRKLTKEQVLKIINNFGKIAEKIDEIVS